jgi:SAM-dependent methyltransferase
MSETNNSRTIETYNGHVQEYIDGTPHEVSGTVKEWIDRTFASVSKQAHVFELGSAFGRDAAYLQNQGYHIECSDATPAFVDLLRQKGFDAQSLNAISDELPQRMDVVLANAVLLHFTREEATKVINKVYNALNDGGTFAFTLKQGDGEEWSEDKLGAPRFFTYWTDEQIREILATTGFQDVSIWGDRETERSTWLQIIAKKP